MEAIDLLKNKTIKVKEEDLIQIKKRNYDYIISIPHSGTWVPKQLVNKFNINKRLIIGSDLHTEKVYKIRKGVSVISRLNPYVVDMNRFKYGNKNKSLPKHLRIGALHRMSPSKPLLRKEHSLEEKKRIFEVYDNYHSIIKRLINEMKERHGFALLFDCHSMSSVGPEQSPDPGRWRPEFSVGTLDDTSAHPAIISTFCKTLKKESERFFFDVEKNFPYNGGAITRKYSNPSENVHAIQIEINESIFMNEGFDDDYEDHFKIKLGGLRKVNSIIEKVFKNSFKEAKKLYQD